MYRSFVPHTTYIPEAHAEQIHHGHIVSWVFPYVVKFLIKSSMSYSKTATCLWILYRCHSVPVICQYFCHTFCISLLIIVFPSALLIGMLVFTVSNLSDSLASVLTSFYPYTQRNPNKANCQTLDMCFV